VIARRWRGRAGGPANADAYVAHFERAVRPRLDASDGFVDRRARRAGRRAHGDRRRHALESLDAIRAFAGDDIEAAVVEPEARAVLDDFDARVRHIELRDGVVPTGD
jgi:hypothetical protein